MNILQRQTDQLLTKLGLALFLVTLLLLIPQVTSASEKNVAVILFNFQNDTSEPWTTNFVSGVTFDNSDSVDAYYQENSYGQLSLSGDVFGWYTIPQDNTLCNPSAWATVARTQAENDEVDLSGYDNFIYAFPNTTACNFNGLANTTSVPGESWINGFYTKSLVGHEIGHTLGTLHANSYNCTDGEGGPRVTFSNFCVPVEHGDPFDIMGTTTFPPELPYANHMNGFRKGQVGFLPDANLQTVTTDGTYNLAPLEGSGGIQSIRIPRDFQGSEVTRYYYLDFRQPIGTFHNFTSSDPVANGISLRLAGPYITSPLQESFLLDATPNTSSFFDSALALGQTYTDFENGLSITVTAVSLTEATVDIVFADVTAPTTPTNLAADVHPHTGDVDLTWTASTDNIGVTEYWVYRDGEFLDVSPSTAYTDTSTIFEQTYNYTVQAVDAALNFSAHSESVEVTIPAGDTTPPTVAITNPSSGAFLAGTVNIAATATDDVAIDRVEFYRDSEVLLGTDTTAPYSYDFDTTTASLGSHTLYAEAYDLAGNVTISDSVTVTVDNVPPTVSINNPDEGDFVKGNVTFAISVSGGTQRVEFYRDNNVLLGTVTTSPFIFVWDSTTASDGAHTAYVKAYDFAGNVGTSSVVSFTVDNTAPVVNITAPTNGSTVNGAVTVAVTATDNVGVSKVEFWRDGLLVETKTTAPYDFVWDTTTGIDRSYTLQAKAYNLVNTVSISTINVNVVNNAPPVVSITAPTNNATVSGVVTISANASDTQGINRVEFYRDGSVLLGTDTTAPYSFDWNTTIVTTGSHTLTAKAFDTPGNSTTSTAITVIVQDVTAPVTAITSPANGATVAKKAKITIQATATDFVGVTKVEFFVDNVLKCTDTTSSYTCLWTVPNIGGTSFQLKTKAYDSANNIGTSAIVTVSTP